MFLKDLQHCKIRGSIEGFCDSVGLPTERTFALKLPCEAFRRSVKQWLVSVLSDLSAVLPDLVRFVRRRTYLACVSKRNWKFERLNAKQRVADFSFRALADAIRHLPEDRISRRIVKGPDVFKVPGSAKLRPAYEA